MDTNLLLRDGTSDLSDDESLTAVLVGPMNRPMVLHVLVPEVSSGDDIDVELEFNDDGSTQIDNMNMANITAAGLYSIPFFTWHKYLLVKLETSNASDDHGAVKVWIAPAHRYDTPYNA